MLPDSKNYYPLERFVLHKAKIDPDGCHGSVDEAITKQLPGWERAEAYLNQLENYYYSGDESDDTIIDDGNFGLYIHKPFAQSWRPMSEKEANEIRKKVSASRDTSLLLMLAMFIEESDVWQEHDGTRGAQSKLADHDGTHGAQSKLADHDGTHGAQSKLANHIRSFAEKRGWSGLAMSTINRRLKQAIDAAKDADAEARAKARAYLAD